jgi:exopolysaccharide production protein ExoZ
MYHSWGATPYHFAFGAAGVDLFFVISGFVMWHGAVSSPQTPGRFWSRRIRRIVPLYWTSIAAVVLLVRAFGIHPLGATDEFIPVMKSMLFIPYLNSNGSMGPVVSPGWTLNYEMFFYEIFGLSLFIINRFRFIFLAGIFQALFWCGRIYEPNNILISYYLDPICIEFWFGVVAAELSLRFSLSGWTGVGAMIAGVVLMWAPGLFAGLAESASRLTVAAGCSALVMGIVGVELSGKLPRMGWVRYGGEASYALYLAQIFGFEAVRPLIGGWPGPAKALAFASSALLAGFVTHRFVEKPMSELLRARAGRRRKSTPLAVEAPAE